MELVEVDGWVWDEEMFDVYLIKLKDVILKGKMVFVGLCKEEDCVNVIVYLV